MNRIRNAVMSPLTREVTFVNLVIASEERTRQSRTLHSRSAWLSCKVRDCHAALAMTNWLNTSWIYTVQSLRGTSGECTSCMHSSEIASCLATTVSIFLMTPVPLSVRPKLPILAGCFPVLTSFYRSYYLPLLILMHHYTTFHQPIALQAVLFPLPAR
jgi:hypothetical protein